MSFDIFFPKSIVSCMFQSSGSEVGCAHCLLRLNTCQNRACGFAAAVHSFRQNLVGYDCLSSCAGKEACQEQRFVFSAMLLTLRRNLGSYLFYLGFKAAVLSDIKQTHLVKHPWKFLLSKLLESHLLYRSSVFDLQGELHQSYMPLVTEAYWVQHKVCSSLLPHSPQPTATKLINLQTCQRFQILNYNYVALLVLSTERLN